MSIIENAFDKDNARSNNKKSSTVQKVTKRGRGSVGYPPTDCDRKAVATTSNFQVDSESYQPFDNYVDSKAEGDTLQSGVKQPPPSLSKKSKPSTISSMLSRSISLVRRNKGSRNNNESTHNGAYQSQQANTSFNKVNNNTRANASGKILYIEPDLFKKKGMVSHSDDFANPIITNEYRLMKHKVLDNIQKLSVKKVTNFNMMMITSINPSEGKTFSAINMALSIASEKNNTILLVDANTHNPSICSTLGLDDEIGLIDFLLGNVDDISDVIFNTNIPNLKILPAGTPHHLSNELLSSVKMQELASELSSRYSDRVIIFDCPPLLGVVETVTISKLMGQAIIVVEHLVTKFSDVEQGISEIKDNLKTGFIVNKAIGGTYSQYGHGYEKKIPNS